MSTVIRMKLLMARVKAWLDSARRGGFTPAPGSAPRGPMPSSTMISEIFDMPRQPKPTPPQSAGKGN